MKKHVFWLALLVPLVMLVISITASEEATANLKAKATPPTTTEAINDDAGGIDVAAVIVGNQAGLANAENAYANEKNAQVVAKQKAQMSAPQEVRRYAAPIVGIVETKSAFLTTS